MTGRRSRLANARRLIVLSARLVAGRQFWIAPLLTLIWPAFQLFRLLVGWRPEDFNPGDAQVQLIALPMVILGIALGVRIIAAEIDRRTLEIAYTVPGGTHRVWVAKLVAAAAMLLASEALLALIAFLFFTEYPPGALYGALQAGVFYLVLSMALAALFKSEATGALAVLAVLVLNGFLTGFGGFQPRLSPFWNPTGLLDNHAARDVLAWTVQNRIGFLLIVGALVALAFGRAESREKLLSG